MICAACRTGFENTETKCPSCGAPAVAPASAVQHVGSFGLACLYIARIAALIGAVVALASGGIALWRADYLHAALLVCLGAPISIGHFVAFGLAIEYARTR